MTKNRVIVFTILLFCMIFRYSFLGFEYFPTTDDNNQYGIYNLRNDNIYENVIQHYKGYNVRPLAFFTDAYVFSWFWDNMYLLLLIMIIMHFFTSVMFENIMEKLGFKFGLLGMIIFTLSPFLVQSTYWISAASRLVVSLFLCISSIRLFICYIEKKEKLSNWKKVGMIFLIFLLNILSVGYYEQTIVFNFIFFVYVIYKYRNKIFYIVPSISTTLIGIYYYISIKNNAMQERGNIRLDGIIEHISHTISFLWEKFVPMQASLLKHGIINGFDNSFAIIMAVILGIILAFFVKKEMIPNEGKYVRGFILGIVLFVVPFAPFLILQDSSADVRNFYISYLGLGLMASSVYYGILGKAKHFKVINVVVLPVLVFTFMICNYYEISNYKNIYEFDNYITAEIIDNVDSKIFDGKEELYVDYDIEILNFKNKNSVARSVLEEDWALMGKIQLMRDSTNIGQIIMRQAGIPGVYIDKNLEIKLNNIYNN